MFWGTLSSLRANFYLGCYAVPLSDVLLRALRLWRQGYSGGYGSLIILLFSRFHMLRLLHCLMLKILSLFILRTVTHFQHYG